MPTITNRDIQSKLSLARRNGRTIVLWDSGLGCRITPNGKVSWLVKKSLGEGGRGAKQVKHVFGHYPEMAPEDARNRASALREQIRVNVNPNELRRQVRKDQLKANADVLGDAVALYFKKKRQPGRYWDELVQTFARDVTDPLGRQRPLSSITKQELRHLIETKQESYPGAARTLFAALRPFFGWCVRRDLIATSPLQGVEPPELPKARNRILTDQEIKSFWTATAHDPLFGPFHRLLMLTAQRREEVSGMQWMELDLERKLWIIPKERTKNGKEHLVHLSPQAMVIITNIAKIESDSPFVFSTTGETNISGYGKAKARLDKLMKTEKPWRVHDLRRTAASGMAALGFQPHIIERVLNHLSGAQGGLVSVYQRHEYLPERKRALEAWGAYVENLVSEKQTSDNVVPLVRA